MLLELRRESQIAHLRCIAAMLTGEATEEETSVMVNAREEEVNLRDAAEREELDLMDELHNLRDKQIDSLHRMCNVKRALINRLQAPERGKEECAPDCGINLRRRVMQLGAVVAAKQGSVKELSETLRARETQVSELEVGQEARAEQAQPEHTFCSPQTPDQFLSGGSTCDETTTHDAKTTLEARVKRVRAQLENTGRTLGILAQGGEQARQSGVAEMPLVWSGENPRDRQAVAQKTSSNVDWLSEALAGLDEAEEQDVFLSSLCAVSDLHPVPVHEVSDTRPDGGCADAPSEVSVSSARLRVHDAPGVATRSQNPRPHSERSHGSEIVSVRDGLLWPDNLGELGPSRSERQSISRLAFTSHSGPCPHGSVAVNHGVRVAGPEAEAVSAASSQECPSFARSSPSECETRSFPQFLWEHDGGCGGSHRVAAPSNMPSRAGADDAIAEVLPRTSIPPSVRAPWTGDEMQSHTVSVDATDSPADERAAPRVRSGPAGTSASPPTRLWFCPHDDPEEVRHVDTIKESGKLSLGHRVGQLYQPLSGDAVDVKLAAFINDPSKRMLRCLFRRLDAGVYFYGTRKARLRIEPTTSALEACDEDCLFWASIDEFVSRVAREQRERVLCATTSGRDNSPEAANTRAGSSAPSMELEGQHGTLATRGQHDSVCEVFPATPGEAKHVSVHFKVIVGQNHPF